MRWLKISCRSFWIQNSLWAIFGCRVMSKIVLGVFWQNWKSDFFRKHPKLFCSQLGNQILLRGRFLFKTNGRISSITSYKGHCCSFFTSGVIKQQKKCILKILKNLRAYGAHPRFVFTSLSSEILILTNPDFEEQLSFWWKNC